MKIALCGPSGSGKTTIAKYITELSREMPDLPEINFLPSSATLVMDRDKVQELKDKFGDFDGHADVIRKSMENPEFGFEFQTALQEARDKQIAENDNFVIDRSPIDNWVYFLMQAASQQPELQSAMFLRKCMDTYKKLTHVIFIHTIKGNEVENNGSRIDNIFFQRSVNALFNQEGHDYFFDTGEKSDSQKPYFLELRMWDLGERRKRVKSFLML